VQHTVAARRRQLDRALERGAAHGRRGGAQPESPTRADATTARTGRRASGPVSDEPGARTRAREREEVTVRSCRCCNVRRKDCPRAFIR
jgi:hypothetical protein